MIQKLFKKYKKISLLLAIFGFTSLLLAGCTEKNQELEAEELPSPEETNIETVETVLRMELIGPDKEFLNLKEGNNSVSVNGTTDKFENIESYLTDKYEPYFTTEGLDRFIKQTPAYLYHYQNHDYQMSIEEMEVKQSEIETSTNQYYFTVQVALESANEEKQLYEVSGKAIFSEEGRIGRIDIQDKDQLLGQKLYGQ